ncbi:MAG: hypothetical protein HPY90_03420 [Syntrophothermus sp.]|uniref:acyl-CoA dehydratase activase-related protein n=1 Tax=Syntrophothermus sp. TaxID=2736299 RepID=UPI00257B536D|nr:acyl-CoA dehydratase activase-related protein [Syntrophothermus sp.]NSW82314.1 hypothetical protein [Syntrophothermus sp.]
MQTVGIPRGLFYYYYFPLWKTFFLSLGYRVVTSPATNRRVMDEGILTAVDEACLPVKVYFGHVRELCRKEVDYLFVPRLVSVEPRSYICPKLMGIPDMLKAQVPDLPLLIEPKIDMSKRERDILVSIYQVGKLLNCKPKQVEAAYRAGQEEQRRFNRLTRQGYSPDEALQAWETGDIVGKNNDDAESAGREKLRIGVLGHGYSLYDKVISLNVLNRLKSMKVEIVTLEMLPGQEIEAHAATLPKRMFWTLGRKLIGGALKMDSDETIDGIIYLACFGCGPDSLVGQIIQRRVRKTPFMLVTVDEHTGEAGLVTRLEAFCDMIWRRKQVNESHLSPHG